MNSGPWRPTENRRLPNSWACTENLHGVRFVDKYAPPLVFAILIRLHSVLTCSWKSPHVSIYKVWTTLECKDCNLAAVNYRKNQRIPNKQITDNTCGSLTFFLPPAPPCGGGDILDCATGREDIKLGLFAYGRLCSHFICLKRVISPRSSGRPVSVALRPWGQGSTQLYKLWFVCPCHS